MKRIGLLAGLLAVLVAALGVTSLMADHKGERRGRRGRFGDGAFRNGRGRGVGLPPGLARRGGNLPPGLAQHLQRTGQLPPGLQRRGGGRFNFNDRGVFVDRDQRGRRGRLNHRKFHRGLRERHGEFHERYPDLDAPDARRGHRRFHGRQQKVHREVHRRRHDRRENDFGRRNPRLSPRQER